MSTAEAFSVRVLSLDSRDRDHDAFPLATRFDAHLPEPLRDVTSLSVRAWSVPRPFPVAQGQDTLWVEDWTGVVRAVEAPYEFGVGAKSTVGFLTVLSGAMSDATGQSFQVVADDAYLSIRSDRNFALYSGDPVVAVAPPGPGEAPRFVPSRLGDGYGPRSVGRVLGLAPGRSAPKQLGPTSYELVTPVPHSFLRREAAHVRIEGAHTVSGTSPGADGCILVVDDAFVHQGVPPPAKVFHPPLSRLAKICVSVVDRYGNPLRAFGEEVRIELVATTAPATQNAEPLPINNVPRAVEYIPQPVKVMKPDEAASFCSRPARTPT
jgi:hypothetical protein